MDKLEKYVRGHREGFDNEEPREDLWNKIKGDLQKQKPTETWFSGLKVWRAAAVILLLTTSWLVFDKVYQRTAPPSTTVGEAEYLSEFQEVESYYMTLVREKKDLLVKASSDDPDYRREFLSELEQLDDQYKGLKENLKFGNQEEVINALIINLQMRIEILNRQLEVMQEVNKQEDDTHESII